LSNYYVIKINFNILDFDLFGKEDLKLINSRLSLAYYFAEDDGFYVNLLLVYFFSLFF